MSNPQFASNDNDFSLCKGLDKGTIMLISDLALLEDAAFKSVVEEYAADQSRFFADFVSAWTRLQENGVGDLLRDELAPPK